MECIRRHCNEPRTIGHFCDRHQPHMQVTDDMISEAVRPRISAAEVLAGAIRAGYVAPAPDYINVP